MGRGTRPRRALRDRGPGRRLARPLLAAGAVARRLALLLVAAGALAPSVCAELRPAPEPPRACTPEGRGTPPRHWVGCRGDPGPPRALSGAERLALGLPLDLNRASAEELAAVPGIGPALAARIVEDRARRGPFPSLDDLRRVRGVGPARLARARGHLETGPPR